MIPVHLLVGVHLVMQRILDATIYTWRILYTYVYTYLDIRMWVNYDS